MNLGILINKKNSLRLIGLIIFVYVIYRIGIVKSLKVISESDPLFLGLAVFLYLPIVIIQTVRWQILLRSQKIEYSFKDALILYLSSVYIGIITPGRVGEFIRVIGLKRDRGLSIGTSLPSIFVERLLDLFFLLFLAVLGTLFFSIFGKFTFLILIIFLVYIGIAIIFTRKTFLQNLTSLIYKIGIRRYKNRLNLQLDDFYQGFMDMMGRNLFAPFILTSISMVLFFIRCYAILLSLDIPLSIFYLSFCVSVASLVALIPITIAGIGTREILLISLFSIKGVEPHCAIAFSILYLFLVYVLKALLGLTCWTIRPIKVAEL